MPYVDEVEQAAANPELSGIYDTIEKKFGFVPHFFKALGPIPEVIKAQLQMNAAIMAEGALSALVKEQIGVVVSGINSSSYCIAIHMEVLRQFGIDKPTSKKLVTDYMSASVDDKTKVLFRFADKLTRKPLDVDEPDADEVLHAGWSRAALREAVLTVAFFNYINRVSFGLGLVTDF
ncbi:MAG TPA: peroxidase-related enzyme [Candidatus Acidoferrales bacterium]|nr:peroxidase-related enzyme [Candidatus Acidoferrales bacterium]